MSDFSVHIFPARGHPLSMRGRARDTLLGLAQEIVGEQPLTRVTVYGEDGHALMQAGGIHDEAMDLWDEVEC